MEKDRGEERERRGERKKVSETGSNRQRERYGVVINKLLQKSEEKKD